jgi:hypothetical protein
MGQGNRSQKKLIKIGYRNILMGLEFNNKSQMLKISRSW